MKLSKKKVSKLNVLVIGDLCIDRYYFGSVDRISPEGPIPILNTERVEERLGMAANVALNLKALGANVTILSDIPLDNEFYIQEFVKQGFTLSTFNSNRKTIYKNRLVSNNQILYRFDQEEITSLDGEEESRIVKGLENDIRNYDAVVLSDYGKGFFREELITRILGLCKKNKIPTFIDPDIRKPIHSYLDSTVIKLNQKELQAWDVTLDNLKDEWVTDACDYFVVTLGNKGMLCKKHGSSRLIDAKIESKTFVDTTGAGDTALAILTIAKTLGYSISDCMRLANAGAGLVVQKMGTSTITLDELNKCL